MARASRKVDRREIVLDRRLKRFEGVAASRHNGLVVVLEDLHDPHNAEAILRSCDALGVQDVYFIFEQQPFYNPRRIGKLSSSSANKWLTCHTEKSTKKCLETLRSKGYRIVATVVPEMASEEIYTAAFDFSCIALVVGNEKTGVSATVQQMADRHICIPMRGMVDSFNVSVATAIFLYEINRQKMAAETVQALPSDEQTALVDEFLKRSTRI